MIVNFDDEDVEVLLDPTFFLILEYWPISNEATRRLMENLMQHLLDTRPNIMAASIHRIPSLGRVPDLQRYEDMLKPTRQPLDPSATFGVFAQRISHENSGVVLLALSELVEYLR